MHISPLFLVATLAGPGSVLAAPAPAPSPQDASLTVHTQTGTYTGARNARFPSVREFRNIPYAQAPVGPRRWLAPLPVPTLSLDPLEVAARQHYHDARDFPPSCPQFVSASPNFFNVYAPALMVANRVNGSGGGIDDFDVADHMTDKPAVDASEDCLRLAVWTPDGAGPDARLPVLVFVTGGRFVTGGVAEAGQVPAAWVGRTGRHIVVTINYRLNIFGWPNAAGLAAANASQNVGLLDQRLALEWVRDNIAPFGGDPARLVLWGQSAGSESVDYLNYAFWDAPVASGSVLQSGTALKALQTADFGHTNFSFVAGALGCGFKTNNNNEDEEDWAAKELDCMRRVPEPIITAFVGAHSSWNTTPPPEPVVFAPIADEVLVFADYPARARQGLLSPRPAVVADCANEDAVLVEWPAANLTAGPWQPAVDAASMADFICPAAETSRLRGLPGNDNKTDRLTYRYQFAGNFSSLSPLPWLGAYHASDSWMLFGTYYLMGDKNGSTTSAFEVATSAAMQDYILAFAEDPVAGPRALGWHPYTYGGDVVRFGAHGVVAQNVSGYDIDGPCYGNGTYDSSP